VGNRDRGRLSSSLCWFLLPAWIAGQSKSAFSLRNRKLIEENEKLTLTVMKIEKNPWVVRSISALLFLFWKLFSSQTQKLENLFRSHLGLGSRNKVRFGLTTDASAERLIGRICYPMQI
jgi:hypothetical protein